jgi:hypothetical protein
VSLLLLLLAAQGAAPEIRTERSVTVDRYTVTPETAQIVEKYNECLFPGGSITWSADSGVTQEEFKQARVSACGEIRQWAVSAATSAYRPEPGGERDAAKFVNRMFDLVDADYLEIGIGSGQTASATTDAPRQ